MNTIKTVKALILLTGILLFSTAKAQDKPNILWLVTEDMSPYLSCYGNKQIKTPNLDKLAAEGIRYTHAYSNGTQCSPSRSTLITGNYSVSLGSDMHRKGVKIVDSLYFPIYLRKAGYYCVNNPKQDYNNLKTPDNVWDESGHDASYTKRADKSKPFFAMYNQFITHMTRVAKNIDKRSPDDMRTVSAKNVDVPPYIPALPEVRDDISWYLDAVIIMDKWVGDQIAALKANGEYENTIIVFSSDHGGCVPRGKAYAYESGTHIPFIVHFPEKWKKLAGVPVPAVSDRIISFVDIGATFLSLAGQPVPSYMTGKPFLTAAANKKENIHDHVFTFRSNQGPAFLPTRTVNDGRYHLMWNFQSAYPNGTRQDYQWQMPAQQAWDRAYLASELKTDLYKKFWLPMETFELYDTKTDSLEIRNLANDPKYAAEFKRMKAMLHKELHDQQDLGLIPPLYRYTMQKTEGLPDVVRRKKINIDEMIDAAEVASMKDKGNLKLLIGYLANKNPMVQYWGASGLCGLTKTGKINLLPEEAKAILAAKNAIPEVQAMLAEAMIYTKDSQQGLKYLLAELNDKNQAAGPAIQNIGKLAMPIAKDIQLILAEKKQINKFYIRGALINCGVLPYSDLYKLSPGEKISD